MTSQLNIETLRPFASAVALNNVPISSTAPTDGMALVYDSTAKQWIPKQVIPPSTPPGSTNLFAGTNAGIADTTGDDNVGLGNLALTANTTGFNNTAIGSHAMASMTTGDHNVAVGDFALALATSAQRNTGVGEQALYSLTTGIQNSAFGALALKNLQNGLANIGLGTSALQNILTGDLNVCIGNFAGQNYTGAETRNIVIGRLDGSVGESETIRIGNTTPSNACFINGIFGKTSASGTAVFVNASGQLGTSSSARRFKEQIVDAKDYDVSKLRVCNFVYKGQQEVSVGLIAEEVGEAVLPELVVYDNDGLIQTVKYMDLIPILLQKIQRLETEKASIVALTKLTQKVDDIIGKS